MVKSLKERLGGGEPVIGSWITLSHPAIAEIMVRSGFEWLVVDLEHSAITLGEAQNLIQVIELSGVVPLVRVGENNPTIIKRVMDAGAHGVIVPMVNSGKDAEAAVSAVRYPPLGSRGVGLGRAQGYGLGFEKYKGWLEKEAVVIVQIEHVKAVDNLDEILRVEGVDGFIVGPYDLSGSMGRPGDFGHPEMTSALDKIMDAAKKHDPAPGFHVIPPDAEEVFKKMDEGYRFIGFSLDTLFLGDKCTSELSRVKERLSNVKERL